MKRLSFLTMFLIGLCSWVVTVRAADAPLPELPAIHSTPLAFEPPMLPIPQSEVLKEADGVGIEVERSIVHNWVNVTARHCGLLDPLTCAMDDSRVFFTETNHNLRTTAGGDWQASVMGNTAAPPATCNYIAVSNDSGAPVVGDTVVAGEITTNGLARAQGVYAHTASTAAFTIQKAFSATGTQASQKAGLLNASSTGTLCFENTYTGVTVNNGDTLTVTWTINY